MTNDIHPSRSFCLNMHVFYPNDILMVYGVLLPVLVRIACAFPWQHIFINLIVHTQILAVVLQSLFHLVCPEGPSPEPPVASDCSILLMSCSPGLTLMNTALLQVC